jgi:hypothetical protein
MTRTKHLFPFSTGLVLRAAKRSGAAQRNEMNRVWRMVTLSLFVGALGFLSVSPATAAPSSSTVRLREVDSKGATHTYEVLLTDEHGASIGNADLDLGGLGADPDLRVSTTPMKATEFGYRATVRYPADGDWVLVVRVHSPVSRVELFTTKIDGAGAAVSGHGASATPSRRAVLAQDPTFFDRYTPGGYRADAGEALRASSHSAADQHATAIEPLDPVGLGSMLAHSLGAVAWMVAVFGLALAGRLGHGPGRRALVEFVAARYQLLAGGGLALVTFTGLENLQHSSPGLLHPSRLLTSRVGSAYLAVFVFKMLIVVASMVTTWKIGRLLPSPVRLAKQVRLASVGAMANDDPVDGGSGTLFRLVEMNAVFAGAIIVAVSVLGQLHHVLH